MPGFHPESTTNLTDSHGLSAGFVFTFKHIGGPADSPSQGRGAVADPVRAPRQLTASVRALVPSWIGHRGQPPPCVPLVLFPGEQIRGVSVRASRVVPSPWGSHVPVPSAPASQVAGPGTRDRGSQATPTPRVCEPPK